MTRFRVVIATNKVMFIEGEIKARYEREAEMIALDRFKARINKNYDKAKRLKWIKPQQFLEKDIKASAFRMEFGENEYTNMMYFFRWLSRPWYVWAFEWQFNSFKRKCKKKGIDMYDMLDGNIPPTKQFLRIRKLKKIVVAHDKFNLVFMKPW